MVGKIGASKSGLRAMALLLAMLVALSGAPGVLLGSLSANVAVAEEGREDAAKLLVYSRMIERGLATVGLEGAGADEVASALGISVAEAEELLRIASLTPQEIFSIDPANVSQLKERADYYYEVILSVIEAGIDREEVKKALDRALLERIADVVGRIGKNVNDTLIAQAAEQVRNATSMEEAQRVLSRVVERLQALNIYMLSETLDDALLKSLEKLVDEADMGGLEEAIEKMREEISEVRNIASRYGAAMTFDDPDVESRVGLALEKISLIETTLESMDTVANTIANATGNASITGIDPARVLEAGVKTRISLLGEKLAQVEAQVRSMLEAGMADPQWASWVMNTTERVRQLLANATALLAAGDVQGALHAVGVADEVLTRVSFEVSYKSVEMQALVQAKLAAARSLLAQVEARVNETSVLIERLMETASATGAQATLATLEQARIHLQNAVQLAEQARQLLASNDTTALDVLNQALQKVMQANAMANAARTSLTVELQVLAQVAAGNQTQVQAGGNVTVTVNATGVNDTNVTSPGTAANATAPGAGGNQTAATPGNGTVVVGQNATVALQAQVEARLAYAEKLMGEALQLGMESAYEYAFRAVQMLRLALNLTLQDDVEGAKALVGQAEYYIIEAEMELSEHVAIERPEGIDLRYWEVKKDLVEVEYELGKYLARMEAFNISDPLALGLAEKARELLNQSRTLLDQGDIAGALDALYRAEDLVSYVEDLVEAHVEEDNIRNYTEGPMARLAEAEYLVNKALAKIEKARAQPGFDNSTEAQALVEQALQMVQEAKQRLEEARNSMEQGLDYASALSLAISLAKGAEELADKAIDLAEKAWEMGFEERQKAEERLKEQLDKIADLREKALELRLRIEEMKAAGVYDEGALDEAGGLVDDALQLLEQAGAGEQGNAQAFIARAEALLERVKRILEAVEERATRTTTTTVAEEESEETVETQTITITTPTTTATEYYEQAARIDKLEEKAYRMLDHIEALAEAGSLTADVTGQAKAIVEEALAYIEAARRAMDTGVDALQYIEIAEELLSKAEDILESAGTASAGTGTPTETQARRGGEAEEEKSEYESKLASLRARLDKANETLNTHFDAGIISEGTYSYIVQLLGQAQSALYEAYNALSQERDPNPYLKEAEKLIDEAESILENSSASTNTTPITETPSETQAVTTTSNLDEEHVNEVKDKIADAQDKASELRGKALELQAKAVEEGQEQALDTVRRALNLIDTASTMLSEATALVSEGNPAAAEQLVNTAEDYLDQAESLLDEAESLLD